MADAQIAALEAHIVALQQLLVAAELKRIRKQKRQRLEAAQIQHARLTRMLRLQQTFEKVQGTAKRLQRQKQHKQAQASLKSAKAQHAKMQREAERVKALQRVNAEKMAMIKLNRHHERFIEVLELPAMVDQPAWDSDISWQPYQLVKQQTYSLTYNHKLSKPSLGHMRIRLSEHLFARGGFRYVYYAQSETGQQYVAKRLYGEGDELQENIKDVEADIKDHLTADNCIRDFHQRAKDARARTAPMNFTSSVSLIIVDTHESAPACGKVVYFLEPIIQGTYCKWIQNSGDINTEPSVTSQEISDSTQAMVHFSYEMSLREGRENRYMITDVQGFMLADGSTTLIDPAICRPHVPGVRPTGADYGIRPAANAFFKAHKCSDLCHALKLPQHEA